jgi:uncharacterized protein YndB with AHSA1/START domain
MAAINTVHIAASPSAVFATLSLPDLYVDWVVGASDIRDADSTWPAPGTQFHHTQGVPHVGLKDTTEVLEADPPRRLVLEVRARPIVVARVTLDLVGGADRTTVTMTESPIGGWLARVDGRVLDRLIALRNTEALRRLKRLCERRTVPATVS